MNAQRLLPRIKVSQYINALDVSYTTKNTRFLLLSRLSLDDQLITEMEQFAQDLFLDGHISFPILRTGVEFKNIKFKGI